MAESLADRVLRKIGEACELYHHLILMVTPAGSGKTFQTSIHSSKQWRHWLSCLAARAGLAGVQGNPTGYLFFGAPNERSTAVPVTLRQKGEEI